MTKEEYNKKIQALWKTNYNFHEECRLSIDIKEKYITSLETTIKAQEIIIRDKTAFMDVMSQSKTCEGCKWYEISGYMPESKCYLCSRRLNDYYEPKAQQ